ncbi:glucosamine-6-phosphate deaminase [Seinonella peptonophila]|uniref:Glucosamine-6-phosphate deaminase n=1 Tax=Seinonella peptonophila TaxID=112248 RepID=A0A1M4VM54_9BACL|nr:glucosamine-6-phosphate deaminase [Seinonella peptonophila]SHE70124.1 glucosamine-6-phosphate deaminase [Seinonella peptonophila]
MQFIQVKDYQQLCEVASQKIIQIVKKSPNSTLGLATGGTPEGIYRLLCKDHQQHGTSYQLVQTVNLDEYVGLAKDHPNSYHYYMQQHLFSKIDLPEHQAHIPNGLADDLEQECERYEQLIERLDGVDLQILGIGQNGHIGFNEPGTSFSSRTHIVKLAESTRLANQRFFHSIDEVPRYAITMGIGTIMKSKSILLLVNGVKKATVLRRLFEEEVHNQLPASILKHHPHVTIVADEEAASQLKIPSN